VVAWANGSLLNYDIATSNAITVQASDGAGGTSTTSFTIAVANVAPTVVNPVADVTANEDQANTSISLAGVFADTPAVLDDRVAQVHQVVLEPFQQAVIHDPHADLS